MHREEFITVGVILHARILNYLDTRIEPRWHHIESLQPTLDREVTRRHIDAFESVCRGDQNVRTGALETPSDRFHWLTASRSAVVQTSAVHPGRSLDPAVKLDRLFREQVGEQA